MTGIRGSEFAGRPALPARGDQLGVGEHRLTRKNGSITHIFEKPFLVWLAGKIPEWVNPDHLTAFGLLGAAVAFGGYLLSGRNIQFLWLADLGIVVNWLGDSLDGTMARVRREEREHYGFFVDHSTDLLSQLLIGFGVGLTPFVRFDVACLGLIAYLVLVAYVLIRERAIGSMQISFGWVGPTEVRVGIIGLNMWMLYGSPGSVSILHAHFSFIDLVALCASAMVFASLPLVIAMEARRIADAPEPRPSRRSDMSPDEFGARVRAASLPINRDEGPFPRRGMWR